MTREAFDYYSDAVALSTGFSTVPRGQMQYLLSQLRFSQFTGLERGVRPEWQPLYATTALAFGLWTLEELFRGNCVICRTQRVIQGDDNGHVGRHC
jgi:hypothetical protein